MQEVAKLELPPTPMVQEDSWGARGIGTHASTTVLYVDAGHYHIEWDIPALESSEEIGLTFEHKTLVDYDGIMSLPKEAAALIRKAGFVVPHEFED